MKRSAICKLSIVCAVCCGVIGGISIAPLVAAAFIALFAIICLLCCVLILFIGVFVWLFTAGQTNIFSYATKISEFALALFKFLSPLANFSFRYITPIAGWIALGVGVLGIIISSVGISKAKKQPPQPEDQDTPGFSPAEFEQPVGKSPVFSTPIYEAPPANADKKKLKKKKTDKSACTASLVVCIVFSVVAIIAISAAPIVATMF